MYLVGSDRISTELHNLNEDANASLPKPMTMDYELNDPADPRVDLHAQRSLQLRGQGYPDHLLHDRPAPRLSLRDRRSGQDRLRRSWRTSRSWSTATGSSVANLDHLPARDNKGPSGRGKGRVAGMRR